jgi:hypothetical protein
MNWKEFKIWSEEVLEDWVLVRAWGFQFQPGTKWNPGLPLQEIKKLEKIFGFEFPTEYQQMLLTINGLDRDMIAIDPDGTDESEYGQNVYQYPADIKKAEELVNEIKENIYYVKEALRLDGYDPESVIGFVPLYGHQALAVFYDKSLSPVISIHQGTDVVVVSESLMNYWKENRLVNDGEPL